MNTKQKTIKTIRPKSSITCVKMNCIKRENEGKIKISCVNCRDKTGCMNQS